jgi:hypothetical protein
LAFVIIRKTDGLDVSVVVNGAIQLDDGDVICQAVTVPLRMLNRSADAEICGCGSITCGGNVMVTKADMSSRANSGDGVEAVGGSENGVPVDESASAHDLESVVELLSS